MLCLDVKDCSHPRRPQRGVDAQTNNRREARTRKEIIDAKGMLLNA